MTEKDLIRLKVLFPYVSSDYRLYGTTDHISHIIKKPAYNDMTPRHLKGIGNDENKSKMIEYTIKRFVSFFDSEPPKSQDDYDNWHIETCDKICSFFKNSGFHFKYGKAQKLVNIAFKHFLLFEDAKYEYFIYCHTPIDCNVLKWCNNIAGIKCRRNNWSGMEKQEYIELQNSIREYLNSKRNTKYRYEDGTPYSNLAVDFDAWIEYGGGRNILNHWKDIKETSLFYCNHKDIIEDTLSSINK